MKQVLIRRGGVTAENVPAPMIEDGHVLVEVAYSLISPGTEISSVQSAGKPALRQALEQPERVQKVLAHLRQQGIQRTIGKVQGHLGAWQATGYSCSGTVVQVGQGITDLRPGDLVACAGAGIANHAELVLAPRNLVARVPEGCDLRSAASATIGAIAMQGLRRADLRLGEIVAVIGLGLLGQLTAQLLRCAGCRVIGLDVDTRRTALARTLGADQVFNPAEVDPRNEIRHLTGDHGVDATIITAASDGSAIVQQAMEITRKKGRVVVVGAVGMDLQRSPFYQKELDFLISCSYGPGRYDEGYEQKGLDYPYAYVRWTENRNMAEYLRLVAAGKVQLAPILEREHDLADAARAYDELKATTDKPLGVVLRYPPAQGGAFSRVEVCSARRAQAIDGRVRLAVIGAGSFAKATHLPNLQRLSDLYQVRAIVSATGSNATAVAAQYGAEYATTNFEDVLSDPGVDAVLIATRHDLHAPQVVAALQAGKHVFCEKPLVLDRKGLEAILACYGLCLTDFEHGRRPAIKRLEPVLTAGFNRRFSPAAGRAAQILAGRACPLMIFYRVNAGYAPPDNWMHGEGGGGRILGEGCHMFDLFQYLVGPVPVEEVVSTSIAPEAEHLSPADNAVVTVRYGDGSVATLLYTALGGRGLAKEYVEIHSGGKSLVIDDYRRLTVFGSNERGWRAATQAKGHLEELQALAACLKRNGEWPIPLADLVQTARVSLAAAGRDA